MLRVEVKNQTPHKVNNVFVSEIIDTWRLWPRWWEGNPPRDYFKVQVAERTMDIYQDANGWTLAKVED
jgi:hypothetical protein